MDIFIKIRHDILIKVMGIIWWWKNSISCLRLTFKEIPHKNIWVSWGVLFKGMGVQKDTQTPCWLRPCLPQKLDNGSGVFWSLMKIGQWQWCVLVFDENWTMAVVCFWHSVSNPSKCSNWFSFISNFQASVLKDPPTLLIQKPMSL